MRLNRKLKRGYLPTFLVLIAMLVIACSGQGSQGNSTHTVHNHTKAPADKQILISGQAEAGISDLRTFDPALAADTGSQSAVENVFTGLVQFDHTLHAQPQLASGFNLASDGVTWTFKLRHNLQFSDGTPLTSADVVYSITRALAPATRSPLGLNYLNNIKGAKDFNSGKAKTLTGISAPDDNTVVIVMNKPAAYFLQTLTYPTSYVVEQSVVKKWGTAWTDHLADNGGQGGDGPFKVKEFTHGKQIVFIPNPKFYGPKPQLSEVIYPFFSAADSTYQVYQVNNVDDTAIPSTHLDTDRHRPDFVQVPQLAITYFTMNYLQKPFDIIACRQAFALAINKDLLAHSVYKDAVFATNHIVPQGEYGYNSNLTGPLGTGTTGDTGKAKQALQQCMQAQGYSSLAQFPPITLTYASSGQQAFRNQVAAQQQMWQSTLGISVKIDDIDFIKLIDDENLGANNPLQFYAGPVWIADYPDPQDWITLQFDRVSAGASNSMSFGQNKGPDAAVEQALQLQMEQADVNNNMQARAQAYNSIEQQLVNDVAWMPIYQNTATFLRKPCVQGFADNALGIVSPNDWGKIFISTDTPCASPSS